MAATKKAYAEPAKSSYSPVSDDERLDRLKAVFEKAKTLRDPHQHELRDCYLFTLPARECFQHVEPGTQVDRRQLFDSTATDGVLNLTTLTMRLLVPQNDRWAGIEVRDSIRRNSYPNRPLPFQLQLGIDEFNRRLFEIIAQSNFYMAADEAETDCIIAGTACLAIYGAEDRHCPIEFRAIHPEQFVFTENAHGMPDLVFREHKLTGRQLLQRWDKAKLPADIARTVEEDADAKHKVVEIEEPLDDGTYAYSCHLADSDWYELEYMESRFRTFIVFRWSKASKEVWGESQVRHALPAIRSLNRLAELIESHGEYAALGLWQNTDDATNLENLSGKLVPGAVINVDEPLTAVPFPGKFEIAQGMLNDLRAQVKQLLFDTPLPSTAQNNYMSATEVNARLSEYYRRVGQPALRMEREFLDPVVRSIIGRLVHFGWLPKPAPAVMTALGVPADTPLDDVFTVTVTSAISKVLRINDAQSALQAFAATAQGVGPQVVFKHVDIDKFCRMLLVDLGMPLSAMRSEEDVAAIEEKNEQLQRAQMIISGAQQLADLQSRIRGNQTNGLNQNATQSPLNANAPGNQVGLS